MTLMSEMSYGDDAKNKKNSDGFVGEWHNFNICWCVWESSGIVQKEEHRCQELEIAGLIPGDTNKHTHINS